MSGKADEPSGRREKFPERQPGEKPRRYYRRIFLHCVELIAVAVTFLQRNAIARFVAAKLSLDFVVEVTDKFGAPAGHRVSTVVAAIVAEPRLLAAILAGILIAVHLIIYIVKAVRRRRRHRR